MQQVVEQPQRSKRCTGPCGENLPLSAFYKRKHSVDGCRNACKDCFGKQVSGNRKARLAQYKNYEQGRRRRPERIAADKARRTQPQRLELQRRAQRRYYAKHRDRQRARGMVCGAIRRGQMSRQACFFCNAANAEAHHFDYSRPFDILWVCAFHHRELEGRATGSARPQGSSSSHSLAFSESEAGAHR